MHSLTNTEYQKRVVLLALLNLMGLPSIALPLAFAQNTPPADKTVLHSGPQWSEFCGTTYCEAVPTTLPEIKEYPSFGQIVFATFVPVLLPSIYRKQSEAQKSIKEWQTATEQNYWADRRVQFNSEIAQCQQIQANDKLIDCYMNIRQMETTKNQGHQQEALMRQQIKAIRSIYPNYYLH